MISREQIAKSLEDPQEFKRIFKEALDLRYAGEKYSDQSTSLVSYLLLHTEEFDRIVDNRASFIYLAEQMPGVSDAIIRFVLSHPEEFNRLIKNKFDLKACARSSVFKNYAGIFQKPTLATARAALREMNNTIHSNREIFEAVRYLSLGNLDEESTLNVLPTELIIKIVTYMRDPSLHSNSYAKKAARNHYGKPNIKK